MPPEMHGMDEASARRFDGNGWYEIKRNPISKVGVFPYLGKSIDTSLEPDKIYQVYRPAKELSDPQTIESFKLVPWVDMHPPVLLGPDEAGRMPAEEKGVEGVTGEDVFFENDTLYANLKIFSDTLADKIDGGVRELSLGYGCQYEVSAGVFNGVHYDAIQRNIRGNHIATVPEGRMGPNIAVLDHLKFTFDARDIKMPETTEKSGEQEISLDDVMSWGKENLPKMKKMADMIEKHFGSKETGDFAEMPATSAESPASTSRASDKEDEEKDKEGKDRAKDESEKDKEKEAGDEKKCDDESEEKEKKDKEAGDMKNSMDAAISQVRVLQSEIESIKKNGVKSLMQEISKRNALAGRISDFTGAFDHSEMTEAEVAVYGVKKLGLKCPPGYEMTALDGYFTNRRPQSAEVGFALDGSGMTSNGKSDAQEFYSKSA